MSQSGITEDRARVIMTGMLKEYEREVVEPRHKETQDSIGDLKGIVQRGAGAAWFAGILAGMASVCWIVLQIRSAIMHP